VTAPSNPASDAFTPDDWHHFYDAMRGQGPRPLLLQALQHVSYDPDETPRLAVDLGCGEGRDTAELLRRGFRVFAFDGQEDAVYRLLSREDIPHEAKSRLTARVIRYEYAAWPRCNLLNAAFALPFCPPESFPALFNQSVTSLLPGGIFCGQLFGDRDEWATKPAMTHHTREQAEATLAPLHILHFAEEERDGTTASGTPKHWHIFHFIAKK
jgi:trans-aconitate methyltransferase